MLIDIICVVLLATAIFKGFSRGLIVAVFSILAFIVGIAAAMKLSTVVAVYLGENITVAKQWLPVISFAVVFIVVVLLVRLGAGLIEKTVQLAMLGWANRLAGIVLYAILYMLLLSVFCFYAAQIRLISPETLQASKSWPIIQPWGPWAMNGLGKLIPYFQDMFSQLQAFFDGLSHKVG
jgi:membrane protein required for colicin V production